MPQEFHVVQCFNCGVFQVDIVKKSRKWTCKLCGEKQSLIKVYGSGPAKDCRGFVQDLNKNRLKGNGENLEASSIEENLKTVEKSKSNWDDSTTDSTSEHVPKCVVNKHLVSKWTEFISYKSDDNNEQASLLIQQVDDEDEISKNSKMNVFETMTSHSDSIFEL